MTADKQWIINEDDGNILFAHLVINGEVKAFHRLEKSLLDQRRRDAVEERDKMLYEIFKKEASFDHTKIPNPQHCPHCDIMLMMQKADYRIKENFESERARTLGEKKDD